MKIKIAFYSNPAKEDTKETYYFDNLRLIKLDDAAKP